MSEGIRYDQGKAPMGLLPFRALRAVADVLGFGAQKYAPNNWAKGMDWSRIEHSLLRHFERYKAGEKADPESGLSHLAHLACNALFLLEYEIGSIGTDDRAEALKDAKKETE